MGKLDSIRNRAKADLVMVTEQGDEDLFLWEHSVRVTRSAQMIMKLPHVQERSPDQTVVVAAALYHDSGWIARLQDGEINRGEILVRPISSTHHEQGALIMEASLMELLSPKVLERVAVAIRSMTDRKTNSIEGQIVNEANSLDEFGLLAFWSDIRRGALDGKGVQAAVDTWNRRKEYHFWAARLNDSFRFDEIRELARERLAKYERAMEGLAEQHGGADLVTSLDTDEGRPPRSPITR